MWDGFFNSVFCFLKDNALRLLRFRESSVRNFVIFTACYVVLNVSTRLFLLKHFSNSFDVFVIYWMVTIISTVSLLSIVMFYIRNNHMNKVEEFLNLFVDVKRIKENKRKRIEVHQLAAQQFDIDLRYKNAFPLVCVAFALAMRSQSLVLTSFVNVAAIWYCFYFRKIDKALESVEIPPALIAQPSRFTIEAYKIYYFVWENLKVLLWGPSLRSVVEPTTQAAQSLTRRQLGPATILGFLVATGGGVGGLYTGMETYYTSQGLVSWVTREANIRSRGYASNRLEILHTAWDLEDRGYDMRTYCFPGTKTLDPKAVRAAKDELEHNLQNGIIVNRDMPPPIGPHVHELKQFSFEQSPAWEITEQKEIDFISNI